MTEPPPMVPSAHDRLISQSMQQWTPGPPAAERAIEEAYRDGVQAIIAELREPSGEMLRAVWEGYKVEGNWTFAISEALRALADYLEHQTTTVGRID